MNSLFVFFVAGERLPQSAKMSDRPYSILLYTAHSFPVETGRFGLTKCARVRSTMKTTETVWAFDLGKASIGEAVREGNKFLHKESLLIPAASSSPTASETAPTACASHSPTSGDTGR